LLTQGKDDNETGRKKDKQDTVNTTAREYIHGDSMTICTLASSSSGNCTIVSHGNTHLLVDDGISMRRVKEGLRRFGLSPDSLTAILITHEHTDHISGVGMLIKYFKTPVFTSCGAGDGICSVIPEAGPYVNCFETGAAFELGDITVRSFRTPHDATESVGFKLMAGGKALVYATDLGHVTDEVIQAALGSDIALIEANHDHEMLRNGPYPDFLKKRIRSKLGHLENCDCGAFATRLAQSGTRYLQLSHLSRENNTPSLARRTVAGSLEEAGISNGKDVELDVAPPFTPGRTYVL